MRSAQDLEWNLLRRTAPPNTKARDAAGELVFLSYLRSSGLRLEGGDGVVVLMMETTLKGRAETEKELQRSASPLVDFVGWGMMQKSESKASETKRKGEGYSIILLDHYANRLHFQVGIDAL